MKEPAQKKRFIAGVTCPSCNGLDKIYVTEEGGEALMICNTCGYREPPQESPQESQKKKGQEWQPIKVPDSGESSS
jgi:uncharacterized metal-binding protein (TIGR02443 family)